jgi:hypothetical protein
MRPIALIAAALLMSSQAAPDRVTAPPRALRAPAIRKPFFNAESAGAQGARRRNSGADYSQTGQRSSAPLSKTEFEIIEGRFHDGLGTYAELTLANALVAHARLAQPPFDTSPGRTKILAAIAALPASHPSRPIFEREIVNIEGAARAGAAMLLAAAGGKLLRVRHVAREFADAKAGDLRLEFADRAPLPVSVKTDKSGKVAVAEGQTPDIGAKWAARYFRVSESELRAMANELGFSSLAEMKADYLNVARLVALILMRKLELTDCEPTDFSRARVGNVEAVKYLFRQLLRYKRGSDESRVVIFDRATGEVKWESRLDAVDIDALTGERISFRPSRPRGGRPIGSEFGIKVDGRVVVTFQVKHKRGRSRGTAEGDDFGDITTRLQVG